MIIIPLPIDPDYKTNIGRINITPPIIPLIIPIITIRDPAYELLFYSIILATFVDIYFKQRLIILLFLIFNFAIIFYNFFLWRKKVMIRIKMLELQNSSVYSLLIVFKDLYTKKDKGSRLIL